MSYVINGLKDMHTILSNERKVGGVIEADNIRLKNGEEYVNAVITNIDLLGSALYSIGFVAVNGQRIIVNVSEISMINQPQHKKIYNLNNQSFKTIKIEEKLKYLKRLYEVNVGSYTSIFLEEAKMIVDDIGLKTAKKVVDVSFLYKNDKLYTIA